MAYCYRPSNVVCRSVTVVSPAKTADSDSFHNFWMFTNVCVYTYESGISTTNKHVLNTDFIMTCVSTSSNVSLLGAKTVPEMTYNVFSGTLNPTHFTSPEPIEMPFGLRTQMSPRNHVLDGSSDPPWEVAILKGGGKVAAHCKV